MPWLVAMTEVNREIVAKRFVEKQGRVAYLPMIQEIFSDRIQPLFPRYLFIHSTDGIWRFLTDTIGILKVLISGDKAQMLPDRIVNNLRRQEKDGIVKLEGLFYEGEKVQITSHPLFADRVGVFVGMKSKDRCSILLNLLGCELPVEIEVRRLKRLSA